MSLSLEVKGYLADLIARESLGKIKIIGMRVGIAPDNIQRLISRELPMSTLGMMAMALFHRDPYEGLSQNEKAAVYITETGNQDLLIETVLDFAKKEKIGGKRYSKIYGELNSIMERTMHSRLDEKGSIVSILDEILQTSEKETFIERKLEEFEFNKTLANYKEALKTYKTSKEGSISLLRLTFEALINDILESNRVTLKSNQKDKLTQLEAF
jgi:hypothetical protein